jgi:DNA polymerase-3 subunit epsilon
LKIKDINFLVVDVETTGSKKAIDRVIDIACVVVQNGLIVDQFSTLLNPERHISKLITKITGINNDMVQYAPVANEVMPEFEKYFKIPNAVFVGHFVDFDYSFVNIELVHSGLERLQIQKLDTLKLAQRILPDNVKKNVGSMSKYYGVQPVNRHRALGDAKATAYSLIEMLSELRSKYLIEDVNELLRFQDGRTYQIKSRLKKIENIKPQLQQLTDKPGVFKFLDEEKRVIYIGYAGNIKERVNYFFSKSRVLSQKIPQLVSRTEHIEYVETNTILSAMLMKNQAIFDSKPEFNTTISNEKVFSYIKITNDEYPTIFRCSHIKDDGAEYIGPFTNRFLIDNLILNIQKNFRIRTCRGKLNKFEYCIYRDSQLCFNPCERDVSKIAYYEEIGQLKQYILKGYEAELRNQMNELSDKMEFESAAFIRNQIYDLKKTRLNPVSELIPFNTNYIAIMPLPDSSEMGIFFIKSGMLKKDMTISAETDQAEIYEAIVECYSDRQQKRCFSNSDLIQCQLIQNFISRGNGDVKRVEILDNSSYLDIFEECNTMIDSFFLS